MKPVHSMFPKKSTPHISQNQSQIPSLANACYTLVRHYLSVTTDSFQQFRHLLVSHQSTLCSNIFLSHLPPPPPPSLCFPTSPPPLCFPISLPPPPSHMHTKRSRITVLYCMNKVDYTYPPTQPNTHTHTQTQTLTPSWVKSLKENEDSGREQ